MVIEQENRKPIYAYNPPGIEDISLIKAVIKNGGIGLVDLDRLDLGVCENLIEKCQTELKSNWGIRVTNKKHLELLARTLTQPNGLIIILSDFQAQDKEINLLFQIFFRKSFKSIHIW